MEQGEGELNVMRMLTCGSGPRVISGIGYDGCKHGRDPDLFELDRMPAKVVSSILPYHRQHIQNSEYLSMTDRLTLPEQLKPTS